MRIAMIGQKGIPCAGGGIERHVEDLSRHLVAAGYDVTVYTRPQYTPPRRKTFHGVRLITLPSIHTKHLDAISHSFIATVHAMCDGYDIIHYHGVGPVLCAWLPRFFTPHIRVVGTYHCDDWKQEKWSRMAKVILRMGAWMMSRVPHHTIAVSHEIFGALRARGTHASYIPTGVAWSARRPSHAPLAQFGLGTSPYILIASRFIRHKSVHDAIDAFKLLKAEGGTRVRKLKLALVGGGSFTDEYMQELQLRSAGCRDIVFTGFQHGAALESLFAHTSLFLQPSSMEGRSIALLEAMAWGVPVAAANIKESREVLMNDGIRYGSLFALHNLKEIAAIMRVAVIAPARMRRMAAAARQRVVTEYDWNKITPLVGDVYMRLSAAAPELSAMAAAVER